MPISRTIGFGRYGTQLVVGVRSAGYGGGASSESVLAQVFGGVFFSYGMTLAKSLQLEAPTETSDDASSVRAASMDEKTWAAWLTPAVWAASTSCSTSSRSLVN